jgi:16S rRNA (cytidine1402-2'-O)-methyltransferase
MKPLPGTLFVVGVPIGHPDDVTLRALAALRKADVVASEHPVATHELLRHHGIHATITSYGPAHLSEKVAVLLEHLQRGISIALVSDCGSPVISDPGSLFIRAAHAGAIPVESVPGPSALTAAVAAAGLSTESWIFGGELPESKTGVARCIAGLLRDSRPTILFCTADSLAQAIPLLARTAPRRRLALACNLTMPGERIVQGTALQVWRLIQQRTPGEQVTLIVAGGKQRPKTRLRNNRHIV